MDGRDDTYYRTDLALVHHRGYSFHADGCAEGVLSALEPILERDGLVLEIGCGAGALTRHLVGAGHRVIATDASPAMLELARDAVPDAEDVRQLTLPEDPLPSVDAIVSVGHALNYLADAPSIERSLIAMAGALRHDGVLAIDLCDLRWARVRRDQADIGRVGDDWAIVLCVSVPSPDRFVRDMTTFVRNADGSYRRDGERHDNVLVETSEVPQLLAEHGVDAHVVTRLGDFELPDGLVAILGSRRG